MVPALLIELSPDYVRSLLPGFVYQLGVLLTAPAVAIEYVLHDRFGYPWALTMFEVCVIVLLLLLFGFGPERLGRNFREVKPSEQDAVPSEALITQPERVCVAEAPPSLRGEWE